jgi:hypothetical protein
MNARSRITGSAKSVLLLAAAACASAPEPPPPAPWVPGVYDFEATLEGQKIIGQIEVTAEGPMGVATDRGGDCDTYLAAVWHPWERARSFGCSGHSVTVSIGSRVGPVIRGTVGTSRRQQVTELVRANPPRCETYDDSGRVCVGWAMEERTVTKNVPVSAPIRLIAAAELPTRP